jgi:ppGpp synthetase/RelA/SpoT-type nucleotidyltranferase
MRPILKYSKREIDKAGNALSGLHHVKMSYNDAIEILENFRSIHIHPLNVFRMSLQKKSREIDNNILVSQRLKRAPSIISKLKKETTMALSQMQDIGGLRAVVNNLKDVYRLKDAIRSSEKQLAFKSTLLKEKDYIMAPKESGYRSIHLIYKYEKNVSIYNQCRIEIQLRTKIQHA